MGTIYIGIANASNETFNNTRQDDLVLFASEPSRIMLGTQSNLQAKLEIGSSNIVIADIARFLSGMQVNGNAMMLNDLYVQGNLITRQDLVLSGVQIASGASYCNGDLYVMNNSSSSFSNANVLVTSTYGVPVLSLHQEAAVGEFKLFQSSQGAGYITNSNNIHIGRGAGTLYATFSNSGWLGIGTSNPRATVDVFGGNVNARNINRIRKSTAGSNDIGITINWQNVVTGGNENCLVVETTQQLASGTLQGTRTQRHRITLGASMAHTPQVAFTIGDIVPYTSLYISLSNTTPTSATLRSYVAGAPGMGGGAIVHDYDLNVVISPSSIGHVWVS